MSSKKLLITIIFVFILTFSLLACEGVGEITINGFSVDYSNIDLDLAIGEDIDLSQLAVTATKSDGTTITLKEGEDFTINLGDFDKTTPGQYPIKVIYKDYPEKTFIVEVKEAGANTALLSSISVANDSTHKTAFAYGEDFSSANLAITATFSDQSTARITTGFDVDSTAYNKAHGLDSEQTYTITISYNGKTTTYSVGVAGDPSKIVNGISVANDSTHKTAFAYGEDFSSANLAITATFSDQSTARITTGFDVDSTAYNKAHGLDSEQTYTITISYNGKTTTYSVGVAGDPSKIVNGISVANDSTHKTAFAYGEDFSSANLAITATFSDQSTARITTGFDVDSTAYNKAHGLDSEQTYTITISYNGKTTTYSVGVAGDPSKIVNGISVANDSTHKTAFAYGEDFSSANLAITATFNDQSTARITTGFDVDSIAYNKAHGLDSEQTYTITISYNGKTTTYSVGVAAVPSLNGISIANDSTHKTAFAYGEDFSSANLAITATFSDQSKARITTGFDVDSTAYNKEHGLDSEQTYTITISYNAKTTTYSVIVAAVPSLNGISIANDSTHKTAFAYGEDFSSANLAITATFSDQSTARITTGFDVDSTAYNKEHGLESEQTYDILLSYMDYTTSYKVTVARAMVVGVYIVDNKVDFKYGEEFSLGNAKFYAMYENSAYTEELTVSEELGSGKCMIHSESYDREHEKVDTQRYSISVVYSDNVSESYEVTVAPIPYWVEYRVGAESTHQTEFGKSETFTYEGLIVESVYGSEENGDLYVRTCAEYEYTIFSNAFDGTTPDTYGCYEVLVRIGEGIPQPLYHIYVTDEYENITEIYAFLVIEQYYQYAELDLTDSTLQVYLSDSDEYTVFLPNDLVEVTGFDSSSVGDKELIFTYKEQECIASYSVIEDEIDYIDVVVDDTFRYQYYLNEELSYQGITVYQVYKSGRKEVKVDYTKETDYDSSTAGYYSLTIEEESTYGIEVYDFSPATAPQDIDLYGENDTFYAEEVANGRWQVEVGGAGEYELTAYLGSDFMSYCDVMLGEYTEGVFFALLSEDFDRYIINYDGTGDLTVTIRITNPNGNVAYTYLTISSEDVYFSEITINGEEIQLSVYNEYRYYINDVANSYVFDWNIDSKYTVTGVVKGSTVTLDSYDYSKHLAIFVQEGNDIVATYEVIMLPYLLVSSIGIGEMDATKEKMYSQTKFVADITNIYGASSYAVDIIVQDGFTTKLRYGGVEIESIDAEILFAGRNYFNVEVYDNDGECVAKYDLDIIIYEPSFMPKYALMKIEDAVVANLNYNPGGNFSKTYYVFDDALETEQNYSLTFYWDGEMPIGTVVTLADNELWENGGDITLNPGRNEFVVKVSDGTNTYYQAFIILYADYNLPRYEPWAHVDLYVAGVQAENNIGILPLSYDVFFITIPNGYDFYTDITNIVEIVTDEGNDISMYEFAYEVNEQHDKITVSVLEDSVLVGYLYVNIIYEGETNADTTLIVYDMTLVEAMREEPLNEVEFAPNTEHDSRMEATISSVKGNFIVFVYPDFASCTVETSVPDAISFIDKHVSMITYEGTGSFEIYFHVTSSDGQEDVNYCLIVNIEEAEDVLALSFGGEDLLELDYTLIDMYTMASENEGSIYIDIPTLQIDPNGFDTINNTVTFVLTSEYLCVEEDTITEISNGIAHTFNMYPNNEEFTTCYMVEFYLCLEDSYSNNGIVHITLYFHLPIMKMTFSDGTSLAQYTEIGDFVWEEDDNLYYEMTMEKFEAKLDVDDKFVVDLTFYMPDFVCYYADETGTYLSQVNDLEIEFIKNTDVLEGTVTFCQRGEADAEDTFTDIVIIVAN